MNRIYRVVWSQVRNAWIAVAENAKGQGKTGRGKSTLQRKALVTALSLAFAPLAVAGPGGGQVVAGSGTITQTGAMTTINQASNTLSLNWQSFNIALTETVNFLQPSAAAIAVNRIMDTNGSQILGHLNANGQVWLINPNGILFGQSAQVNVGGLVASTLKLDELNSKGDVHFNGNGTGSIINQGTIHAAQGGYVALLANQVSNQGILTAPLGTVAVGAGSAMTLTFASNKLLHLQVDQSTLNNLAENGGLIQVDGGQVLLSAGAKDAVLASVVNNTGIIEARTVENKSGTIILLGGKTAGTVNVAGTLDASAPIPSPTGGGLGRGNTPGMNINNGGFIETSAAHVKIASNAKITTAAANGLTGSWLIDPDGFTIAAYGGDMTGDELSSALGLSDVLIDSTTGTLPGLPASPDGDGNININDAVTWNTNKLTLSATNDIKINDVMTAKGTASLDLEAGSGILNFSKNAAGFSGRVDFYQADGVTPRSGIGFLTINTTEYTVITDLATLQGMGAIENLSGTFALGDSIDTHSAKFSPVGDMTNKFTGAFEGLGHSISNISINRPATDNVGLFGVVDTGALISNIALINSTVSGANNVGGLVGYNYGTVSNSYVTGTVSGSGNNIGGLVGYNTNTVINSYASNSVSGLGGLLGTNNNLGGLVGYNDGGTITSSHASGNLSGTTSNNLGGVVGYNNYGSIETSYATGNVNSAANNNVGGLVGYDYGGTVSSSYATGNVDGKYYVGGLVGYANNSTLSQTFTSGTVTGNHYVGGLVGYNYNGPIDTSYSRSAVNGSVFVGGLVGYNYGSGSIDSCYATGKVTGTASTGALIGHNPPATISVTNSFWDTTTTGLTGSGGGGVGMNTQQMQMLANFTSNTQANRRINPDWNFTDTWILYEGNTYPLLRPLMTPLTVTANSLSKIYDGNSYNGSGGVTYSLLPDKLLLGTPSYTGGLEGTVNVGTYTITPGGLYSNDQLGYAITFVDGTLTVTPSPLTVTGTIANHKTYDGTTIATLSGGVINGRLFGSDVVTLVQAGATFASKEVGTTIPITAQDTLTGISANNYYIQVQPANLSANITPAPLGAIVIGAPAKVYDGTTALMLTPANFSLSGFVAGEGAGVENLTEVFTGTLNSKNVLNANSVAASFAATDFLANPGTLLSNYTLPISASGAAHITPATLLITDLTAANKVYDKTTTATLTGGALYGTFPIDSATLSLSTSGAFVSHDVGNSIPVTVTAILNGTSATNYSLIPPANLVANITPRTLTVTGETAANKIYDGTTAVTLSGGLLSYVISGDTVTLIESGLFSSKNVGNAIAVTPVNTLEGVSAGNYSLIQPTNLSANITPASLTITGLSAANKVYDNTTKATLSGSSLNGVIPIDTANLSLALTGTFATNNVGKSIAIAVTPTLSGAAASNYSLIDPANLAADITPLTLCVTNTRVADKVYDGTPTASVSGGILNGVLAGDAENLTLSQSGQFTTSNVSNNIAVIFSNSLAGTAAGNYQLTNPINLAASITPAALGATITGSPSKIYDGTTLATLKPEYFSLSGFAAGEGATVGQTTGAYNSPNVVAAKTISATLAAVDFTAHTGTLLSNYVLPTSASGMGSILPMWQGVPADAVTQLTNRFVLSGIPGLAGNLGSFVMMPGSLYATLYSPVYYTTRYSNEVFAITPSATQADPNSGVYELWYGVVKSYLPRILQR